MSQSYTKSVIKRVVLKKKKYYVYCHFRLDTFQPFYFGFGSNNPKDAWYKRANTDNGRSKLWKSINGRCGRHVEIVFETDNRSDALKKEKYFIALYGRICMENGPLCNFLEGGEASFGHLNNGIIVSSYDDGGKIVKTFSSISEAGKQLGVESAGINQCCSGRGIKFAGFFWKKGVENSIVVRTRKPFNTAKRVEKIDTGGNVIKIFNTMKEAAYDLGISRDRFVWNLNNKRHFLEGHFYFRSGESKEKIYNIISSHDGKHITSYKGKSVAQINSSGEIIKIFETMTAACKELKLKSSHISRCCNGKLKRTGGFYWKFVN